MPPNQLERVYGYGLFYGLTIALGTSTLFYSVGYWEFSVKPVTSAMPARTQMVMLCRIGCVSYV